jgi:hypothetical protein
MWSGCITVDAGGTNTVFTVRVGPIESVTLRDSNGVWRPYNDTDGATLGSTEVEGGGSLANSTWYYVYAWSDAGAPNTLKYQISTTPPTENGTPTRLQQYKRGQTSNYRYLGCFKTDGSGNPLPMRANRGRYVYQYSAIYASGPHRVLTTGHDTSLTTVSCAAAVPPHARVARLRCQVGRSGTSGNAQLVTSGDTTNYLGVYVGSGGGTVESDVEMILDADRELDYLVDNASTACTLNVLGFDE